MRLEWFPDEVVLHIEDKTGRTEVRGSVAIFTDQEPVGDPIVMLLSSLPRWAVDRSALMADEVVGVRPEALQEVRLWLDWHERVTCWFDGQWIGH